MSSTDRDNVSLLAHSLHVEAGDGDGPSPFEAPHVGRDPEDDDAGGIDVQGEAYLRWRLLFTLLWRERFDIAHKCFLVRLVDDEPPLTGFAKLRRGMSADKIARAAVAARCSAATSWRWDNPSPILMTEDSVKWTWKEAAPLNIVAADRFYKPLPQSHTLYFTSGPLSEEGTYERKFLTPGTYHYCSSGSGGGAGCRGTVSVQSEWEKACRDLWRTERKLVCTSLALWLLLSAVLELSLLWVSGLVSRAAAQRLPPLTSVAFSLLPLVLRWALVPAALGLLLLLISLPLALLRSVKHPKLKSFGRGYSRRAHAVVRVVMALAVALLLCLIVAGWLCAMRLTNQSELIMRQLSVAVVDNMDFTDSVLTDGARLLGGYRALNRVFSSQISSRGVNGTQVLKLLSPFPPPLPPSLPL